ncbi:MAG: DUF2325 domain-containing protein [Sphingomonadaceae bacterium]
MSDHPFHVIGGRFPATQRPAETFSPLRHQPVPQVATTQGSRRRKLWEIPHKFHCPVIGVCFDVDQLRGLMARVMHFPRETTDFVLHTTAVGACETRSQLADLLHKHMEKRFQLMIRKFAAAKTSAALHALWREESQSGVDIPGALWAVWTHPACDAQVEQEVYGDIHMIQHQVGSGTRADLGSLKILRGDNLRLRQQLDEVRQECEAIRRERSRETQVLGERVAELRADLAGKEAWGAQLTAQLDSLREIMPDLKDRQALARRANDSEARATALTAQAADFEDEIERLGNLLRHAEETINSLLATDLQLAESTSSPVASTPDSLSGKCILCVGGRSGAVDGYRKEVEQRGGSFLHHDGGLEENLHRIDSALAAADLVICQAGCISHNAYWRVKEQCKRTSKQCLFVKSSGVSSFGRAVSAACTPASENNECP